MAAGNPIFRLLLLQSDAGVNQAYASKAAFQAAGWDLTFKDGTGTALAVQPTWTILLSANGLHVVGITSEPVTETTGGWYADITVPPGYFTPSITIEGDGVPYTLTDLLSQIMSGTGSTSGTGAARVSDALEDWVMGDSFELDDIVPLDGLTKIGCTDLTGVTVRAGWKQAFPLAESVATELFTGTVTVVDATLRTINIRVDTFPVAAALTSGQESVPYVLDISITKAGRTYTAKRYTQSVIWQADTRNT